VIQLVLLSFTFNFVYILGHSKTQQGHRKPFEGTPLQIRPAQTQPGLSTFDINFSPGTCGDILEAVGGALLSQKHALTALHHLKLDFNIEIQIF
jgi:hypothetical protein